MAPQEPIRRRAGGGPHTAREIPDKLYFRIGEVAKLCEVPAYVLRFWESEFPQLKPNKGGTGQRLYRRRDVEMALRVKTLLYDEGYTIAGARQAFKAEARSAREPHPGVDGVAPVVEAGHLEALQKELREIYTLLSRPARATSASVQSIRPPRPAPEPKTPMAKPTPFPKPQLIDRRKPAPTTDSLFGDLDDGPEPRDEP